MMDPDATCTVLYRVRNLEVSLAPCRKALLPKDLSSLTRTGPARSSHVTRYVLTPAAILLQSIP